MDLKLQEKAQNDDKWSFSSYPRKWGKISSDSSNMSHPASLASGCISKQKFISTMKLMFGLFGFSFSFYTHLLTLFISSNTLLSVCIMCHSDISRNWFDVRAVNNDVMRKSGGRGREGKPHNQGTPMSVYAKVSKKIILFINGVRK